MNGRTTSRALSLPLSLALLAGCSAGPRRAVEEEREVDGEPVSTLDGGAAQAPDPGKPAAPGVLPTYQPTFPGAGQSGAGAPLTNGELCDYVPANGAPTPDDITQCFFGPDNPVPAATMEQVLECVDGKDVVHIRLTLNPAFVDNTYGAGSIGWPVRRGHTWRDLYKSDHAEIVMTDEGGAKILQFKIDYISEDASLPTGFGTLGISGGDGSISLGDAAWVLDTSTSIHENINERGYGTYLVDSPLTDAKYTPNPEAPNWDYRVVYEAWVDVHAFGARGFGGATIEYVHASPAKGGSDTIIVTPGECPPGSCTNPDGCGGGGGSPDGGCVPGPDQYCDGKPPVTEDAGCVPTPDVYCAGNPPMPVPRPDACVPTPDVPCNVTPL